MVREFYSWEIINDKVAIKNCDKSFFEYNQSGIPIEVRPYFEIDNLAQGEKKDICLIFRGKIFKAYLNREYQNTKRTRISWNADLGKEFMKAYNPGKESPALRFHKISSSNYEIAFININRISMDINDNLESIVEIVEGNFEGKKLNIYTTKYERDTQNRIEAIRIHGIKCMACGFDFEDVYGKYGQDYIEVHHIKPLHTLDEEIKVNPSTDLVCLCSNCHRMIHRKKDSILTLQQLKEILDK